MGNEILYAFVIERGPKIGGENEWRMVRMTELFEDGTWRNGLNYITSIEDVVERAEKENVPIITRKFLETRLKKIIPK